MPDIYANPEDMKGAARDFASQAVQLADLITSVGKSIDELQGMWKGPAASQFNDLMTQWKSDVNSIQSVLEQVGQKVQGAGLGYGDLDDQIRRGFQLY